MTVVGEQTWSPGACQLCGRSLSEAKSYFDARLFASGQWAFVCPECFHAYGVGLGIGKGTEHDSKTGRKIR